MSIVLGSRNHSSVIGTHKFPHVTLSAIASIFCIINPNLIGSVNVYAPYHLSPYKTSSVNFEVSVVYCYLMIDPLEHPAWFNDYFDGEKIHCNCDCT